MIDLNPEDTDTYFRSLSADKGTDRFRLNAPSEPHRGWGQYGRESQPLPEDQFVSTVFSLKDNAVRLPLYGKCCQTLCRYHVMILSRSSFCSMLERVR